ncbi:MAG TPA: ABC transporter ATP-binding protein [Candidatus Sulfotelmatobacter sp.]|nr:ABC transporter ATP-binding protein [Candidatus Sulfotelmatobacter sp.]
MSDVALRMEGVYKMFRKGEVFNSLRDLIPALTGRMFNRQELSATDRREFWALQDLSFEVRRGEAFGIVGHNGAGKSTALKILSRIMKPTRGKIHVDGRLSALIEVTAGFHQDFTGRENIFLHGAILGMDKREIKAKLDQIIAFSGLEEFIDTPVKRYSSGMYARLGFSVAAHVNPDVLIVDEVLSVGDYLFQKKCIQRMKEVIRGGSAVVFVSHNLKNITEFCRSCLLLEKGRTVKIGPAQDVVSTYMHRSRSADAADDKTPVRISKVTVRNRCGESLRFQSGEKAWIDVEICANAHCGKLSLSIYLLDSEFQSVFDTSTERLGLGNFSLDKGQVYHCSFELDLNLVDGIFHPCFVVYRYDTQTLYDIWEPAATIYVSSETDVRGVVNCFPKVVRHEIQAVSEPSYAPPADTVQAMPDGAGLAR